jgi:hypothetical protein
MLPDNSESENPVDEVWWYQGRLNSAPCQMNAEQYLPEAARGMKLTFVCRSVNTGRRDLMSSR